MSGRRRFAWAGVIAFAMALAAPPTSADRAAADFFTQRGDKAVKEKKWADAQEHYRKATEEEAGHVPATVGLADAFFGAGDRGAAIESWRRAVAKAEATTPLPAGWGEAAARARKRLLEVDAAGTALAQLVDKQADALVALADRWLMKDPEVAAAAVRDALRLRPAHVKAKALSSKVGPPPSEWVSLFDGTSLGEWGGSTEEFFVEDGVIVVDVKDNNLSMHSNKEFKGNFDLRIEAKVLEWRPRAMLGIGVAITEHTYGSWVAVDNGGLLAREVNGTGAGQQPTTFSAKIEALPHPFDPTEWTTYEFQARGKEYHVLVNGQEECVVERPKGRAAGLLGIMGQCIRYSIRKVEAIQR